MASPGTSKVRGTREAVYCNRVVESINSIFPFRPKTWITNHRYLIHTFHLYLDQLEHDFVHVLGSLA